MKKLMITLLALVAVSFASANSFTVSATNWNGWAGTAEYAAEGEAGSLLFAVSVTPALATEVSVGVLSSPLDLDGGELAVAVRGHLPVYDGASFSLGQVDLSAGVILTVTDVGVVSPVFEAGVRTPLTAEGLTSIPGFYYRAGIGISF